MPICSAHSRVLLHVNSYTSPEVGLSSKSFSVGPAFDPFLLPYVTCPRLLLICEETFNIKGTKEYIFQFDFMHVTSHHLSFSSKIFCLFLSYWPY